MELRIDLSDRADIEAAVSLLAVILENTGTRTTVDTRITALPSLDLNGTQDGTLPSPPSELMGGNEQEGYESPNPADVAQSIAGAGALPTVPAGLLGGGPIEQPASSPPASTGQPSASAPAAPAATPAAPAGLDKDGVPWDARIHSSPPSMNKGDGVWRKKKGLNDEAYINTIKAELRAVQAIPAGNVAPAAPAAAATTTPAPNTPSPGAWPVAPAPIVGATAAPSAPVEASPPAPAADPATFMELMPRVTSANAAGILPQSALLDACVSYQLPNIPALAQRPDLVPYVWALMKQSYPALG